MNRYDFLEETIDYNMQKLRHIINSLIEKINTFDKDKDRINKAYNYSIDLCIRQEVIGVLKDNNIDNEVTRNWVEQLLLIYNDIYDGSQNV